MMTRSMIRNHISFCKDYVDKWILKLGLEHLPLHFYYELPEDNNLGTSFNFYNRENKNIYIAYKYPANKYVLAHELGHVYLWGCISNPERLSPNVKKFSKITEIKNNDEQFYNSILDCFVDYRLCKFEGFYDSFLEAREDNIKNNKEVWGNTFKGNFRIYLHVYIESNFLFKKEDKLRLKPYLKQHLKTLRDNAIISSKGENKRLCYQDFQKIDQVLNRFDKIKNTTNSKDVYDFFDSIMAIIIFTKK